MARHVTAGFFVIFSPMIRRIETLKTRAFAFGIMEKLVFFDASSLEKGGFCRMWPRLSGPYNRRRLMVWDSTRRVASGFLRLIRTEKIPLMSVMTFIWARASLTPFFTL